MALHVFVQNFRDTHSTPTESHTEFGQVGQEIGSI